MIDCHTFYHYMKTKMIIYGKNSVIEALKSQKKISEIYVKENFKFDDFTNSIIKKNKIKVMYLENKDFEKLTKTTKHQSIACQIEDFKYSTLEDIINKKNKKNLLIFILDSIEDPHNLGSIIRVGECLGVDGIIIPKNRSCQVNDTVYKTSAGAINHVKIAKVSNINYAIDILKENFINIVSTDADGKNIYDLDISGDIAIVIGSEGYGIHSLTRKKSDYIVSIPMFGKVNSLNASVASGIIGYEILRKNIK